MTNQAPTIKHIYQNHHLDTTRWDQFKPRSTDVVVATSYKTGTTWMQMILIHLVHHGGKIPLRGEVSPWVDMRLHPLDDVIETLEAQDYQRVIKTHLPLDGIPYHEEARYVVVCRDGRDVCMSLWNHYDNYTDEFLDALNNTPNRVGPKIAKSDGDIHKFWHEWITQGWFDWDTEGFPFWSHLGHTQTWWDFKHLPNILFVHYNDLLKDLPGEISRIAQFCDIERSDDEIAAIADELTFDSMKRNADTIMPGISESFKGGGKTFLNKGTNGRWREVLNEEELAQYVDAVKRELTPDCAKWLETGSLKP
jgi:aryl sulfotransferase